MDKTTMKGFAISGAVGLVLIGGLISAGTVKENNVQAEIDKSLVEFSAMGVDVSYRDVNTSLFDNSVSLEDVTISGPGLAIIGSVDWLKPASKQITIQQIKLDQSIPLTELEQSLENDIKPDKASIQFIGINPGVDWQKLESQYQGAVKGELAAVIASASPDNKPFFNLSFFYNGELEDYSVIAEIEDKFLTFITAKISNLEALPVAMATNTDISKLSEFMIYIIGKKEFNESLIKAATGAPKGMSYAELSEQIISSQAENVNSMPENVANDIYPEVVEFIQSPRAIQFLFTPKEPLSVSKLYGGQVPDDLLDSIFVKANFGEGEIQIPK